MARKLSSPSGRPVAPRRDHRAGSLKSWHAPHDVEFRRFSTAGWTVVQAIGELDVASTPVMRAVLDTVDVRARVVIDLSEVTFMDASILRVLVAAWRTSTSGGGALRLVTSGGSVRRLLDLTRFSTLLPVYTNLDDATR